MRQIIPRTVLTLSALTALAVACNPAFEPTPQPSLGNARRAADDRPSLTLRRGNFIVIANDESLPTNLTAEITKANGQVKELLNGVGAATVTSNDPDFAKKASRIAGIRSVIPDFEARFTDPATPNAEVPTEQSATNPATNPLFRFQWGHKAISAPQAWAAGYQGEGATVAILDEGFDLDHPDLTANVIESRSFVPGESAQYSLPDAFSHGTHTAGTVAALDNNIGVIGVAPKAKLMLIKVLSERIGSGAFSWILQGVLYAASRNADVISMSLGAYMLRNGKFLDDNGTPDNPSDDFIGHDAKATQELLTLMTRVMNFAHRQGSTIIAAAGNDAIDGNKDGSGLSVPANLPNVISISATGPAGWFANPATDLDRFASYSNYGTPDISFAAPGGDFSLFPVANWQFDMVLSTGNGAGSTGSYYFSAGTSMACPHAAGVAALIIAKNGGQMDPTRVEAALRTSADDLGKSGRDPFYGQGRVNAFKAVTMQ